MRIIAFITHSADIRQILDHIGANSEPPQIARLAGHLFGMTVMRCQVKGRKSGPPRQHFGMKWHNQPPTLMLISASLGLMRLNFLSTDALVCHRQSDGVGKFIAVLLLMSLANWVVVFWKAWVIERAMRDVAQSIASFWHAGDLAQARSRVDAFVRERLVLPLIDATQTSADGTLAASGDEAQQLTRMLRDALHEVIAEVAVWPGSARNGRLHGALRWFARNSLGHLPCLVRPLRSRSNHD